VSDIANDNMASSPVSLKARGVVEGMALVPAMQIQILHVSATVNDNNMATNTIDVSLQARGVVEGIALVPGRAAELQDLHPRAAVVLPLRRRQGPAEAPAAVGARHPGGAPRQPVDARSDSSCCCARTDAAAGHVAAHRRLRGGGEEAPHPRSAAHVRRERARGVEHGRRALVPITKLDGIAVGVAEEADVVPDGGRRALRPPGDEPGGRRREAGGAVGDRHAGAALGDPVHGPVCSGDVRGHVVGPVRRSVGARAHGVEEAGELAARDGGGRGEVGGRAVAGA
jgi:hypothetical protein